MRKIKLWIETGYAGCDYEEIIEVDDNITDNEIDGVAYEFLFTNVSYGWHEINE